MQTYENYDWASVPIGRGGYITGMKIHPLNGEKLTVKNVITAPMTVVLIVGMPKHHAWSKWC